MQFWHVPPVIEAAPKRSLRTNCFVLCEWLTLIIPRVTSLQAWLLEIKRRIKEAQTTMKKVNFRRRRKEMSKSWETSGALETQIRRGLEISFLQKRIARELPWSLWKSIKMIADSEARTVRCFSNSLSVIGLKNLNPEMNLRLISHNLQRNFHQVLESSTITCQRCVDICKGPKVKEIRGTTQTQEEPDDMNQAAALLQSLSSTMKMEVTADDSANAETYHWTSSLLRSAHCLVEETTSLAALRKDLRRTRR